MLLDTHVLLWALDDDRRLGPKVRDYLASGRAAYFSAASTWELVIKEMLGKLTLPDEFADLLTESGLAELPVTAAHTVAMRGFGELNRHDPFDHLLVAQASAERMNFITADRRLLAAGLDFVRDARA